MDVNRISGYIPGKMVFFLMQVASSLTASIDSDASSKPLTAASCPRCTCQWIAVP